MNSVKLSIKDCVFWGEEFLNGKCLVDHTSEMVKIQGAAIMSKADFSKHMREFDKYKAFWENNHSSK